MYVNEKMKLNKFTYCAIPKPSALFNRLGRSASNLPYSGDEFAQMPSSKVDTLADMSRLNSEMLRQEENTRLSMQRKDSNEPAIQ